MDIIFDCEELIMIADALALYKGMNRWEFRNNKAKNIRWASTYSKLHKIIENSGGIKLPVTDICGDCFK